MGEYKTIDAQYNGLNEYFITPDKEIIEVEYDIYPSDPRKEMDFLSNVIIAHDDRQKIEKEYESAILDAVPDKDIQNVLERYIKDKCKVEDFDENNRCWVLREKDEPHHMITYGLYDDEYGKEYWKDPEKLAEFMLCEDREELGSILSDLDKNGYFDMDQYILISGHVKSETDRYTELGAYVTRGTIIKEYGSFTEETIAIARRNMQAEIKLCREYVDNDVFVMSLYGRDGSLLEGPTGGIYGADGVYDTMSQGTKSLGTYADLEDCFYDNKELLGITIDQVLPLEERIHLITDCAVTNEEEIPPEELPGFINPPEIMESVNISR